MSFKNLEQRYNEAVDRLYDGATLKFDGGQASTGANDDPLITRRPGRGYWGIGESRALPIRSATEDIKRLTLFTFSFRGAAFMAKQQLLQTGNTFESTRILNPAFVLANAIPFVRVKRALDVPITARGLGRALLGDSFISRRLFGSGKLDTDNIVELRKIGQLQLETYNKVLRKKDLIGGALKKIPVIGQLTSAVGARRSVGDGIHAWNYARPELSRGGLGGAISSLLRSTPLGGLLGNLLSINNIDLGIVDTSGYIVTLQRDKYKKDGITIKYGFTNNLLLVDTYYAPPSWRARQQYNPPAPKIYDPSKPTDYRSIVPRRRPVQSEIEAKYAAYQYTEDNNKKLSQLVKDQTENYQKHFSPPGNKFLEYFTGGSSAAIVRRDGRTNARDVAAAARQTSTPADRGKKLSYIKDPSNNLTGKIDTLKPYSTINNKFTDPITVSFAMGLSEAVKFRAYIKDLTQSANPQYKPYQYIGRIEKFISYVSVERTISFKLGIIAFSRDELDGVWTRINYLTGMVYPYGWTRGIFQPNIIRLTIGDVYRDQPGYITGLTTNFNEISDSWEIANLLDDPDASAISRQVPISAMMNMNFTLIEKRSTTAESPFYGITEDMTTQFSGPPAELPPRGDAPLQVSVEDRDRLAAAVTRLPSTPPRVSLPQTTIPIPRIVSPLNRP